MASTIISRTDGLVGEFAMKAPVQAASTVALTLSGEQTIDGIAVSSHANTSLPPDRVLVKDQADLTTNGIYNVQLGAWIRAADFDGAYDAANGTLVLVSGGTVNGGHFFKVTSANPVYIGGGSPSNITFSDLGIAGSGSAPAQTTIAGTTSGAAKAWQPRTSATDKEAVVSLEAYLNNSGVAQTYTFPVPFVKTPVFIAQTDPPCSATTTTLTLPASMGGIASTGIAILREY